MNPKRSDTDLPTWMGRYPRKGADWSPEEDQVLVRAYESGRYLTKEIAARHLREPVAINRRLAVLRCDGMLDKVAASPPRDWLTERGEAQQAVSQIKELFAGSMWPRERQEAGIYAAARLLGKRLHAEACERARCNVKPGTLFRGPAACIAVTDPRGTRLLPLTDLPPEVAQALQFGGKS